MTAWIINLVLDDSLYTIAGCVTRWAVFCLAFAKITSDSYNYTTVLPILPFQDVWFMVHFISPFTFFFFSYFHVLFVPFERF